jgi:signal transduction histidine kinase
LGIEVLPDTIVQPFLDWVNTQSGFWLDMQKVEEPMRTTFAPLKLVSAGCAPVLVGGEYAGVIAFDDCSTLRTDDFGYVDAFLAVANFIGAALQRESGQKALIAEQHARAALEAKAVHEREAAIFQERARFAGQIHDTLAQGFTATLLHLEALSVRMGRGERLTAEELKNVRKIAALGLAEARRSALAIRPLALDGRDLATALQQLTERSTVPGLLDCTWSLCGTPRPLSPVADEALLNIAHEAVNNAIRHADAEKIEIILSFSSQGVSLTVRDDGIGFDASESRHRGHTFGLRSMRERAFAAGGPLKVISKHGKGTTVTVNLSET